MCEPRPDANAKVPVRRGAGGRVRTEDPPLRDALAPYVAAAHRVGRGRGRTGATASPARQRRHLAEARGWLRDNGYPVKDRGRIPDEWLGHFDTKTPQLPTVTTADPSNDETPHDTGHSNGHAMEFQSA